MINFPWLLGATSRCWKVMASAIIFLGFLVNASSILAQTATFAPPQALSASADTDETWGVSSVDVNNDSCPDLFFGNHRLEPTLYLGACDGSFEDRSELIVGLNIGIDAHTTVFGDFHNDGCSDAYVSTGGTKAGNPRDANQLLFGEVDVLGECSGLLEKQAGVDAEYPEQRGRSSVPVDVDYDGDLDLVATGYNFSNQPDDERIFLNDGLGNLTFAPSTLAGEFGGHDLTIFNILANIDGDDELDLICGENIFPRAQCSTDIRASFSNGSLLGQNLSLDLNPSSGAALNYTVDAFAEDIDNDGDNDLVALQRSNRAGNAARFEGNTVVESLNTTFSSGPMRCLGIPGDVDISSMVITGDYLDSRDIKFGPDKTTENIPNNADTSVRRYEYSNISRADNTGLVLPKINDGVDENERGMYVSYDSENRMWRICDVTGSVPSGQSLDPAPQRTYNKYGFRIEFTGPVGELVHEGYDPDSAPRKPIVWINNGDGSNGTRFENQTDNGGISELITAFGLGKGDFDNDGDMDFVASYEHHGKRDDHYLFTNDGSGSFSLSRFDGCPTGIGESIAVLDANGDGRLDPVISCAWFGVAHDTPHAHSVWLNNTDNNNQAIMFRVVGNTTNRNGIGARIRVTNANDRTQTVCRRDVGNTLGRGSQDSELVHCGVALRSTVDVIIDWPGDLGQTIYDNVETGALYELEEGSNTPSLIRNFDDETSSPTPTEIAISVDENVGLISLFLTLANDDTNNTDSPVSVDYATFNGTATAGSDYTQSSGTATIQEGTQFMQIDIAITDDNQVESDETFRVELSNPIGVSILNDVLIVTIIDNDDPNSMPLPIIEANFTTVEESDGNAGLVIRLANGQINTTTSSIFVDYTTQNMAAIAGDDYIAVSGTVEIAPGQRVVAVNVPILTDSIDEPTEAFSLQLSNAVGAEINPDGGVVFIENSEASQDPTLPTILASFIGIDEFSNEVNVLIKLGNQQANDTNQDITVNFATADMSATANLDYLPVTGTAAIAPGRKNIIVSIPIVDDLVIEPNERFAVILSNAQGATIDGSEGIVTIRDND